VPINVPEHPQITPQRLALETAKATVNDFLTWAERSDRVAAERSFKAFVKQGWHVLEPATPYLHGVHVDAICDHLQAVFEGRIKDLIINVPPGHAKSLLSCVFFPAWGWIHRPEYRWLFSSYKATLATRDSVKCRTLIDSEWYQKRWGHLFKLRDDQNEKTKFENSRTGYRAITSVGTGTGERGDLVCVDDPCSVDQAESDAERNRANDWWTGTMCTRLNAPKYGHLVVIQQRLHEEDTTAICLEQGGYEHLYLPAEFEPDRRCKTSIGYQDPRTKEGELLWPKQIGPEEVKSLKRKLGAYRYAGQYQQRPSPAGGGIFKKWWWRYWKPKYMELPPVLVKLPDGTIQKIRPVDLPEEFDQQIQSWDMSFKNLATSDYVAGGVWGVKRADRFLLDQRREQLGFPETIAAVKAMSKKWPKATLKLVEDKANGPAVIATLKHELGSLIPIQPDGSKNARAQAASPQVEAGNVYLPHPTIAPWVDGFIDELSSFPNGKHDDQVDQTTQALNRLRSMVQMRANPLPRPTFNGGERGWMA
jgi:predicted phage terminase large subunit-like protein